MIIIPLEFINSLISSIKDPLVLLNKNGVIVALNKSSEKLLQVDGNELKGKEFFKISKGKEDFSALKESFKKVKKQQTPIKGINVTFTPKTQEQKPLIVDIKPISFNKEQFFIFSIEEIRGESDSHELLKEIEIRDQILDIFLSTDEEETYHQVLQIVLDIMDSKIGYFGYINEEGALVSPSLTREVWDKCQVPDKNIVFPKDKWGGIWGESLRKEKSIIKNERLTPPKGHIPLKNVLCVPIFHQNELIGQIVVGNKDTDYREKDKELLEKIANQISPILYARLERDKKEKERQMMEVKLQENASEGAIDIVDKQILHQLFLDGKKSLNQMKKNVVKANGKKMSHTGINNRIDKLVDEDILNIQGNINLNRLGFQAAFVLIELENYDQLKEYVAHAKQCPRVFLIAPTTGSFHLILGIIGKKIEHINSCLNQCDIVGRKEIKNSEIMFSPHLTVPEHIPIDLFFNVRNKKKFQTACVDCESYKGGECSGCGS
ncbi:MAG: GAF domain-containing protein [Promethearchaeia archaeon]